MSNKSFKRSFNSTSPEKDTNPNKIMKLMSSTPKNTDFRNIYSIQNHLENSRLKLTKSQAAIKGEEETAGLFNFKQLHRICSRTIQERNDKLREEYEKSLKGKLAEQYDTFVKFTFDQILKRSEDEVKASYLS